MIYPTEIKADVSWNKGITALRPEVAVSAIVGRSTKFKVFSVVPDGDMFKWRVSFPNCGKSAACSTERFETAAEAGQVAQRIAHAERPSVVMLEAWTGEHSGYVGSEYAEDYVGA